MCEFVPPEAAYFGIQSYLFTRVGESNTNNPTYETIAAIQATDVFFHRVPNNQDRVILFSSLSNAANNFAIERESGGCWEQFRCFIITPNERMEERVRQVLNKLSIADEDIFTEGIPYNMRFGLDAGADDVIIGLRYPLPTDCSEKGTPSEWARSSRAARRQRNTLA